MQHIELWNQKGSLVWGFQPKHTNDAQTLNDQFDYIFNVREPNTQRSVTWYEEHLDPPIKGESKLRHVYDRLGKTNIFPLCLEIARLVQDGCRVYIHGVSKADMSGPVALTVLYVVRGEQSFDPVAFIRQRGEFEIATQREDKELIQKLTGRAPSTLQWFRAKKKDANL